MSINVTTLSIIFGELLALSLLAGILIFIFNRFIKRSDGLRDELAHSVQFIARNLKIVVIIFWLLASVAVIVINGWILYHGGDVRDATLDFLKSVPEDIWARLVKGILYIAAAFAAGILFRKIIESVLHYLCEKAKDFEGLKANNQSIEQAFSFLQKLLIRSAWILLAGYLSVLLDVPGVVTEYIFIIFKVYLIIALGILCWKILDAIIDSLDALSHKYSHGKNLLRYYDRVKVLEPLFRRSVEYILYLFFATMAMRQFEFLIGLSEWGPRFIRIIGIFFLSRLFFELFKFLIEEVLITRSKVTGSDRQSRLTLVPMIVNLFRYLIYFGAIVLILKEFGIDPLPIIAGAGIVGLAVGLGAQGLMRDIVSGVAILLENRYLVGDYVRLNGEEGYVVSIEITNTRLEDEDGNLHIIPNGEIERIMNFSKEFSSAIVEFRVGYECSVEKVREVINSCNDQIRKECDEVIADLEIQGLERFEDLGMVVRTVTKTESGKHLRVERKIREIIKDKFDKTGVRVPHSWNDSSVRKE